MDMDVLVHMVLIAHTATTTDVEVSLASFEA
jgi:hypothetical protein